MIDWFNLLANSLWIFGLALALAVLSYASWQAALAHDKLRRYLELPHSRVLLNLAGVFFWLGLAATARAWWEIGLWLVVAVAFAVPLLARY
ncbi:MAG: hypothetical protein ACOYYS_14130 [Chloroflexota bacterium]